MAEENVRVETCGEEKACSPHVGPLDQYETGGFRKNLRFLLFSQRLVCHETGRTRKLTKKQCSQFRSVSVISIGSSFRHVRFLKCYLRVSPRFRLYNC